MKLKLKVVTYQGHPQQNPEEYTFNHDGGSFGRGQGNRWKLRDENNFLSRNQANISFQNNLFYLIDVSSNGCYVNNSDFPLGRDNSHHLEHGDTIRVGEYILEASIINQSDTVEDSLFSDNGRSDYAYTEDIGGLPSSLSRGEPVASDDPFDDVFNPTSPHITDTHEQSVDQQEDINNAISLPEPEVDNTFNKLDDTFSHSMQPNQENESKGHTKIFGLSDSYNTDLSGHKESNSFDSQNQITEEKDDLIDQTKKKSLFTDNDIFTSHNMEKEPDQLEEKVQPKSRERKVTEKENKIESIDILTNKNTSQDYEDSLAPLLEGIGVSTSHNIEKKSDQLEENSPSKSRERKIIEKENEIESTNAPTNENTSQDHESSLESLLEGAGIDPEQIKKEIPNDIYLIIGKILHEALQGTMDLLKSRTETKNHLRLDKTIIGNTQNNPLKFMPNAENVIVQLFTSGNSKDQAYLSLLDAMEEAFDDIKAHQFAMAMSIQQALTATMKHYFSPEKLQKKLERSSPISSKIPLQRQAKLWKMFEGTYEEIEREASEGFDALLDKEIAKAYELHMMEIKFQRKNKRK